MVLCFPIQLLYSFFSFAVWRIAMGMRSPAAAALLFPPRSAAPLAQPPALTSEQKQRWGLSRKGRGDSAFLSSCPWGCRSEKGNPALLGRWREGMDHSLSFNMGMASWLLHSVGYGDALVWGRGKVLWLVMPHGDQKGRCMPESMWYCLSFLRTVVFKCLLVDDLLPTAGSVSPV